jgi:hypothetical protein
VAKRGHHAAGIRKLQKSGFSYLFFRLFVTANFIIQNPSHCAKRSKASKKRCLEDETVDDSECEQLRGQFISLREEYQMVEAIKIDPKTFFGHLGHL